MNLLKLSVCEEHANNFFCMCRFFNIFFVQLNVQFHKDKTTLSLGNRKHPSFQIILEPEF